MSKEDCEHEFRGIGAGFGGTALSNTEEIVEQCSKCGKYRKRIPMQADIGRIQGK
ncbi:hypothetical protein [Halomarina ordinaria]|uniref:Uncharacterized protein n=1 Tax=Halomarina ordinaria TaxID=3033939 RepID=A0ABD5UG90_9EURY|nr:hypothetical protein [Halomarina sp. PSRA2]